jgi:hypothetical protein
MLQWRCCCSRCRRAAAAAPATAAATGRTQTHRPTSHRRVAESGRRGSGVGKGGGGGAPPTRTVSPDVRTECMPACSLPRTAPAHSPLHPVTAARAWRAWPALVPSRTHRLRHPPTPPRPRHRSFPVPSLGSERRLGVSGVCEREEAPDTAVHAACCSDALKREKSPSPESSTTTHQRAPQKQPCRAPTTAPQQEPRRSRRTVLAHNGTLEGA